MRVWLWLVRVWVVVFRMVVLLGFGFGFGLRFGGSAVFAEAVDSVHFPAGDDEDEN